MDTSDIRLPDGTLINAKKLPIKINVPPQRTYYFWEAYLILISGNIKFVCEAYIDYATLSCSELTSLCIKREALGWC